MKLRIRGNSIRLRLTKSEVEQLGETGSIEDSVVFGAAAPAFSYELQTTAEHDRMNAQFNANRLSISIPADDAKNWIRSDLVGIEEMQPVDEHKVLRILVEKDFACLSEREGEDDTDAFPNPFSQAKVHVE